MQQVISQPSWFFSICMALVTTSLTLAVGVVLYRWKAHSDEIKAHCDDVIDAVVAGADLASGYWLKKDNPDLELMEAQSLGYQWRVDLMIHRVRWRFSCFNQTGLDNDLTNFKDACTGGEFKVTGRSTDPGRAVEAQANAAQLIVRLQDAAFEAGKFWAWFLRRRPLP